MMAVPAFIRRRSAGTTKPEHRVYIRLEGSVKFLGRQVFKTLMGDLKTRVIGQNVKLTELRKCRFDLVLAVPLIANGQEDSSSRSGVRTVKKIRRRHLNNMQVYPRLTDL